MNELVRMMMVACALFLVGCPGEDSTTCQKVMQCEEDVEMLCERADSGCGDSCHYFVHEHCYEVCKDEG